MMEQTNSLINFLMKPKESMALLVIRMLGYLLLLVAIIIGLYLLFNYLVPIIGFTEAGVIFVLFFAVLGCLLISLESKKTITPY